jgi:trans-AT polyketide synthase/acyltransferase/oxidoreductase domain-containing protein
VINPDNGTARQKYWLGDLKDLHTGDNALKDALSRVQLPFFVVAQNGESAVTHAGTMIWGAPQPAIPPGTPLIGFAPPLLPSDLGDATFKSDLGLKYAYIVGAMANGITSVDMVAAAGRGGMVGFFGAGGLCLDQIKAAIDRLQSMQSTFPFGFNLIHSPNDMRLEMETVALYLQKGIRLVSASAYLGLTLPLVYYRVKGIHQTPDGKIVCPNHIVAKVSRMEVAAKFFAPPPQNLLAKLIEQGKISDQEAHLSQYIPMAQDISAEADSGGHTDNRPALTLLPIFLSIRDEAVNQYRFSMPLRVGLGGGIATPEAVYAAFSMGAAYVLTGSINQAAVEADTSQTVKKMLVDAQQADVTMAPSADMFELGSKVQVLKRGTMFAMRAAKLYDLYRNFNSYEHIPENVRITIERDMLRTNFETAWSLTREYFEARDPGQIERAQRDPKHKMALVFRSYLGQASLWAKSGLKDRKIDYQIWCGPSMGAFNAWVRGSFLESFAERRTQVMAMNLLYGAARLARIQWLRNQGVFLPPSVTVSHPTPVEDIYRFCGLRSST